MTIVSSMDPEAFKKNVLYVTIDPVLGVIVVNDENGKGGGNVNSKQGRKIKWINNTVLDGKYFECVLTFREWLPDTEDTYGGPVWPFHPEAEPQGCTVVIPAMNATVDNFWSGHLKQKNGKKYYKYDVKLIPTNDGSPPPDLDPILIIEN